MTIDVHFHAASVDELHIQMHAFLIGHANVRSTTGVSTGVVAGTGEAGPAPKRMTAAEKKAAEKAAQQAISTGEERVDPEADKQDAADEAADTAREAAEAAAKAAAANKPVDLTHDDVKKLLGGYVQAYGMAAAQEDGTAFIFAPKISEIPNNQAALAKAIIGIAQAIEKNPKNRDVSGDGLTPEKTAELKTIVAAAMAVK